MSKIKTIISREYLSSCTKGIFIIFDGILEVFKCFTLELADNGNKPDISCIPAGKYNVSKLQVKGKGTCFFIDPVPGRSEILIHIGNFVAGKKIDSKGCILPGLHFTDINQDGFIDVDGSGVAMEKLLSILPNEFELTIL